jgi:hypothetical protein
VKTVCACVADKPRSDRTWPNCLLSYRRYFSPLHLSFKISCVAHCISKSKKFPVTDTAVSPEVRLYTNIPSSFYRN